MSVFTNASDSTPEQITEYVAAVLGLLGDRDPSTVLRETPAALRETIADATPAILHQPEMPGKWSVTQILQHLVDSEIVWAWRMRLILAQDRPAITGYDQDRWAARLGYDLADPLDALDEFATLRRMNLRLLERATPADLERVGVHTEHGEESLGHLRKLYAGHDLLHRRQMHRVLAAVRRSA